MDNSQYDTAISRPSDWCTEYSLVKALPSSYRGTPSRALIHAEGVLGRITGCRVLDAGCGAGRNARHLSLTNEVVGIDTCSKAIDLAMDEANSRVKFLCEDAIYYEDAEKFDVVLDSYFSCHILSPDTNQLWLRNVRRNLVDGGLYISLCLSTNDEYYKQFTIEMDRGYEISRDKLSGFDKRLDVPGPFGHDQAGLTCIYSVELALADTILGQVFDRRTILSVFMAVPDT
jgi:SAM-dependent methyltransferase